MIVFFKLNSTFILFILLTILYINIIIISTNKRSMKSPIILILLTFILAISNSQTFNCSSANSSFCGSGLCSGYTYVNNSCVKEQLLTCQQNHAFVNGTNDCVNCSSLNNTSCQTTCPQYMFDGTTCVSCWSTYGIGCTSCNSTLCLSCQIGMILNINQSYCVSSSCNVSNCLSCQFNLNRCQICQRGFQLNFTTFACQQATCNISHCLICNNTNCEICSTGYQLSNDRLSCLPICQSKQCISCITPGTCAACRNDWILDPSAHSCIKDCSNISVSNCFQCNDNFICQLCQPSYDLIFEGIYCAIQSCTTNCLRCNNSSHCLICQPGTQLNADQTKCQEATCTVSYCLQCQAGNTICKSCHIGFSLASNSRSCLPSCLNTTMNCQICSDDTICEFCKAGFKKNITTTRISNCSLNDTGCINNTNSTEGTTYITTITCDPICSISNCTLCGGQNACAACASGLVLNADKTGCIVSCSIINCLRCSGENICEQCRSNFRVQRNGLLCVQFIKDGQVQVTHQNLTIQIVYCDTLYSNCIHCNQNRCLACEDKYALSFTGKQCIACSGIISNCLTCTIFGCLQCSYPYSLSRNRCINCDLDHCSTCSEDLTKCQICQAGFRPVNGVCTVALVCTGGTVFLNGICQCASGSYFNGISCVDCLNQNCALCSSSVCFSCHNGFYPFGANCLPCMNDCQICTSGNNCLKCAFPYSFINGACRIIGGGSTGCIIPDRPNAILRCPVGCSSCQVDSNNTLICIVAIDGYAIYGGIITKCSPNCLTCSPQDPTICRSCYRRLILVGGNCLRCTGFQARTCNLRNRNYSTSCLTGYTVVSTPGICTACSENCARCFLNGAGKCDPGRCINGYVYNAQQKSCASCFNNCPVCDPDDLSICLSCGSRRYKNHLNICVPCPFQCRQCTSQTICTVCQQRYTLVGSTCRNNVEYPYLGYSPDGNSFTCFLGFNLVNNICVFNETCNSTESCFGCPYGFFVSRGICYSCQLISGCKNCNGNSSNNCDLCIDGYFLSLGSCVPCRQGCSLCSNSQNCLRPSNGFYIVIDSESNPTGQCIACTSPCATCIRQPTFCTSCVTGFTIQGSSCFSNRRCNVVVVYTPRWYIATQTTPLRFRRLFINIYSVRQDLCNSLPRRFRILGCARILRFRRCRFGSLQIDTDVDVSTATDGSAATSEIQNSLQENGIDGSPIISSSTTADGFQPSAGTSNLGLILGVSIPLGLILILIIFLMIRAQKKDQQQNLQSWQNVNYIESDQKAQGVL